MGWATGHYHEVFWSLSRDKHRRLSFVASSLFVAPLRDKTGVVPTGSSEVAPDDQFTAV